VDRVRLQRVDNRPQTFESSADLQQARVRVGHDEERSARAPARIVEQIVRATGIVRPAGRGARARNKIDDLMNEVRTA